jgi:probable phosphoglycerate mutase
MPEPNRRRIYLMRHGSVTYFEPDGRPIAPDTVPLNERGIEQALAAGRLFAEHAVQFDRVIASGLKRTEQTAAHVLAAAGQSLPVEHHANFQEIRGGRLADIAETDLLQSFTAATDGVVDSSVRFLGGESIGELLKRVVPAIDAIRADDNWDTLLLVLHGAVNRAILSYLVTGRREMLGAFEQSPACINIIDVGAMRGDVVLRAANLSPLDYLHPHNRRTTMEVLFEQYAKYRRHIGENTGAQVDV